MCALSNESVEKFHILGVFAKLVALYGAITVLEKPTRNMFALSIASASIDFFWLLRSDLFGIKDPEVATLFKASRTWHANFVVSNVLFKDSLEDLSLRRLAKRLERKGQLPQ